MSGTDHPVPPLTPAQQALAAEHVDLARRIARRLTAGSAWLRDEAESAALEALCRVTPRYDPARGVPFRKFAGRRVAGAVRDVIRSAGPFGRSCAAADLALTIVRHGMDEVGGFDEAGRPLSYGSMIFSPDELPDAPVESADTIAHLLGGLPRGYGVVMRLLYTRADCATMAMVGQVTGLSESRVSQIHMISIDLIRQRLGLEPLTPGSRKTAPLVRGRGGDCAARCGLPISADLMPAGLVLDEAARARRREQLAGLPPWVRRLAEAAEAMAAETGRHPTVGEVARRTGKSADTVKQARTLARRRSFALWPWGLRDARGRSWNGDRVTVNQPGEARR